VRRSYVIQGIFWGLVYILLISAPILILFAGELPPGSELWRELSVSLGFLGLAMMTLQFALTARF
jgi:predicted ferric reductase